MINWLTNKVISYLRFFFGVDLPNSLFKRATVFVAKFWKFCSLILRFHKRLSCIKHYYQVFFFALQRMNKNRDKLKVVNGWLGGNFSEKLQLGQALKKKKIVVFTKFNWVYLIRFFIESGGLLAKISFIFFSLIKGIKATFLSTQLPTQLPKAYF